MILFSCSTKLLDFGEIMTNSTSTQVRRFSLENQSAHKERVTISHDVLLESFPANLVLSIDDALVDKQTRNDNSVTEDSGLTHMDLPPLSSVNVIAKLIPKRFASLDDLTDFDNRTTFRKGATSLTMSTSTADSGGNNIDTTNGPSNDERRVTSAPVVTIAVTASFCLSLMAVDDDKIDFDQSTLGYTYVRDFQIWNRSECSLIYQLNAEDGGCVGEQQQPQAVGSGNENSSLHSGGAGAASTNATNANTAALRFQDLDNSTPISLSQSLQIPAYGSKRIRITFKAQVGLHHASTLAVFPPLPFSSARFCLLEQACTICLLCPLYSPSYHSKLGMKITLLWWPISITH